MGYNGTGFFLLWDITEEFFSAVGYKKVFLRCGIQQKRIFSIVVYNGKQSQDGKQIFFCCIPQRRKSFFRCILHHNRILCIVLYPRKIFRIVSHNAAGFLPLYPTMEDIFLHCGIQRKRFFLVVGYNGKSFPPLWDTTEEVFFHSGIQRKRFFSVVGYNGKKLYNAEWYF